MNNKEIVAKLWNLSNVLRDDGITYHQYVTELTYILFLKMAKETGTEDGIPNEYRWDKLRTKSGIELKRFYRDLLQRLVQQGKAPVYVVHFSQKEAIERAASLLSVDLGAKARKEERERRERE